MNSNSLKALRVDNKDRRLLIPKVTENKWPKEKFVAFYRWLFVGDGLGIIYDWCCKQNDFICEGDEAPMTMSKSRMIEQSRSAVEVEADDLADEMVASEEPTAKTLSYIVDQLKPTNDEQKFKSSSRQILDRFRKVPGLIALTDANRVRIGMKRTSIDSKIEADSGGKLQTVIINAAAHKEIQGTFGLIIDDGFFFLAMDGPFHRVLIGAEVRDEYPKSVADYVRDLVCKKG